LFACEVFDVEIFSITNDLMGKHGKHDNSKVARSNLLARVDKKSKSRINVKSGMTKIALEIKNMD
jgi:hypothetical protein